MDYDINRPWLSLDDWQKKYIEEEDNCFLLCGRQSGKSAAMSIKIAEKAIKEREAGDYLVIAFTERQAYALFFKVLMYLEAKYPSWIKRGKDKPTMHEINLRNGITINCHAAGQSGDGLRGYTLKRLFIDEAAPMSRELFAAVMPMLSVTGGKADLASTPRGKEGFFYDCSKREDFKKFYVSAEDCPRHSKDFLEAEKKNMSKLQYAQEYLAVFLDELRRVFSEEWIKKVCVLRPAKDIDKQYKHYLGVDIARMGDDLSAFAVIKKLDKEHYEQVENKVTSKTLTTTTEQNIIQFNNAYGDCLKRIAIDAGSGSLGVGIFDHLIIAESPVKRKVVAINNRERILDREGSQKKKLLKEDLYNNLVALGDWNKIKLLDDDEVKASLASVQYEYVIKTKSLTTLRIFGDYTHTAEAIIRAAWEATQDKTLNIWAL